MHALKYEIDDGHSAGVDTPIVGGPLVREPYLGETVGSKTLESRIS